MQLSGGPYSYNRFDAYEEALKEGKGGKYPKEMEEKEEKRQRKNKARGVALEREDIKRGR